LKTDALRYLADGLSDDIAKILAEERDDTAQRPHRFIPHFAAQPKGAAD
jgi:hypothetical protein